MTATRPAIAIDIGATKIAAALVDADGTKGDVVEAPTRAEEGAAEAPWESLSGLIDQLAGHGVAGVGIGSAGPIDMPAGTVSPLNIGGWRDFPLVERVQELVGDLPVRLVGDGVAAALGEHWRGACRGADHALVAVVSTGIGGGVVSHGRIVTGRTGMAGHVGHTVIDYDGVPCVCGGKGCVEMYASGPSMVRHALAIGWSHTEEGDPDAVALFDAVRDGDAAATAAVDRGAAATAAMIASQGASFDLHLAVLGGGVMRSADVFLPRVHAHLDTYARISFVAGIEVRPAELGSSAGLVGAARLVHEPEAVDLSRFGVHTP